MILCLIETADKCNKVWELVIGLNERQTDKLLLFKHYLMFLEHVRQIPPKQKVPRILNLVGVFEVVTKKADIYTKFWS